MPIRILALLLLVAALALSQGRSSPGRFVDVTGQAGIRFQHQNSPTPDKFLPETMGSGGAFIDYDRDGYLDVFLVNGGWMPGTSKDRSFNHALYRNRKDGTFEDVTSRAGVSANAGYGMGAAVGDYDNDGDDDLFVTAFNGPNLLYRNNGDGTFSDVTGRAGVGGDGHWSSSAAFLDYDNDEDLDLFVVRYVDFTFDNNKICGPYADKGLRAYCTPQVYAPLSNLLYRNDGDGAFSDASLRSGVSAFKGKGLGITVLDYNRDGYADVYVANDSVANFLFRNNRNGTFSEVALETGTALDENGNAQAGMGTFSGDFDGDGYPDIVVTNLDFEYLAVYRNLRNGAFEDASARTGVQLASRPFVGFGVGMLDFDNDVDLDLLVANGHILDNAPVIREGSTYRQRKLLFENTGGTFKEIGASAGAAAAQLQVSRGLALGDYDNDGWMDVLITNCGGSPMLLHNSGGRNSWLEVKLVGRKSNRNGIGARVELMSAGKTIVKEVTASGSYLSSSDTRLHFGLGGRNAPVDLVIHWPSGRVQTVTKVRPQQILVIEEEP